MQFCLKQVTASSSFHVWTRLIRQITIPVTVCHIVNGLRRSMNCTGYARVPLAKDVYIRFTVMKCPCDNAELHSLKAGFAW